MLEATPELLATLRESYVMRLHVTSWRGGEMLYSDIPVATGSLTMDRSLTVPERLTLTVPREADGYSWVPDTTDHPLSPFGQILQLAMGIDVGGNEEILRMGWYPITESAVSDDTVTVTAEGMLKLIDEAKFVAPFDPSGTFTDTVQALVEPALTVTFDGLTDRTIPLSMQWDEDRLGALNEVIDAWPAEAYVTEDGYLHVMPVAPVSINDAVWEINDGATGTVVGWSGAATREGAYNIVVARGEDVNTQQVQGVELDLDQSSSTYYDGPFNVLAVPFFFYSPLLQTVGQCTAAAKSIMKRKRRARSKMIAVEMIPNPTFRLGDVVAVTNDQLDYVPATIENIVLPLNPGGGTMSLSLSLSVGD